MANPDARFGLRPSKQPGKEVVANEYYIPSSYGTALFVGDAVVVTGTANTSEVSGRAAGTMREINKANVAGPITGVIVGFRPDLNNITRKHNPASTERIALVCDDPSQEYEIQGDGSFAATDMGLNANLIATHAGSADTGLSGVELDSGTTTAPATTAGLACKILGASHDPDRNDLSSANPVLRVRINDHTEAHATAGI